MTHKPVMHFVNHEIITIDILIKNAPVNILTYSVVSSASAGLVVWCKVFSIWFVQQCLL